LGEIVFISTALLPNTILLMGTRLRGVTLRGEEKEFYAAAGKGLLIYAKCRDCASTSINPRWFCPACGSKETEQLVSARDGRVHSVTSIQRTTDPALKAPYQVAILELNEGFTMMCRLVGDECQIGDAVRVEFEEDEDDLAVPVARRA
jgi:uncharacterized OB-fold protein